MEIKKVKIRDGMFANVDYTEVHGSASDQFGRVCNNPIHDDFKERMQHLAVHAVLIHELVDPTKVKVDLDQFKHPILEKITVKSISLGDAAEGVTISFERKLSTGKVVNENTPFTKYYEDAKGYRFGGDLQIAIDELLSEVEAYLSGEKFGDGAQLSMNMESNPNPEDSPL